MNEQDAEEFTQALGQIVAGSWRQIALAKRLGIPKALGLSVEEWVNRRLGGYVKLSISDRREAARELSDEGHSSRSIGEVLGVDHTTALKDVGGNPPPKGTDAAASGGSAGENPPLDAIAALSAGEDIRAAVAKKQRKAERTEDRRSVEAERGCTLSDLQSLVQSGRKFGCIYADPPWLYDNQGTRAATSNHYDGLTVDKICALPIGELAAGDAHLHLWTTNAFIFECQKIFKAWGFEFRSSFVWVKPQIGIGNYWRNSHEILLTAIRGDAKRFNDKSLKSWVECDRGAHSAKPEIVRHMIERASPGPFLELFGRSAADGWAVWGNEVERGLLHRHIEALAS